MTILKLALALVLGLVPVAQASSIKELKARSNAAVIAHSAQWSLRGSSVLHVVLTVEASVFGSLQPSAVVNASYDLRNPSTAITAPEDLPRGLWFLKQEESGWMITPAIPDRFASAKNLFFPLMEGDLAVFREPLSDEALTIAAARGLLASGMHPFRWRHMLGREDSPEIRKYLWELVSSPDTPTHLAGLTQLLMLGDVDALRSLRAPRDLSGDRRNEGLAPAVPGAVHGFFRNEAPEAIQVLGEFSNDATLPTALREASAQALSAMHPRESLPYLAKLLDDPNQALRARGVIGLSFFANGMGAQNPAGGPSMPHLNNPRPSVYRTEQTARYLGFDAANETEWIAFWKAWWLEHQFDFE
jgi:hypothetical protein